MKKPIIGVVPLWDDAKQSFWMLPGYLDGIKAAGGLPLTLPLTDFSIRYKTINRSMRRFSVHRRTGRIPGIVWRKKEI